MLVYYIALAYFEGLCRAEILELEYKGTGPLVQKKGVSAKKRTDLLFGIHLYFKLERVRTKKRV